MSQAAQPISHASRGMGTQKTRQVWTAEEDRLLSLAVSKETPQNGSISWHRVAAHLQGRNNKDCRKRWHYSIANSIRKGTWSREEDQKLLDAVGIYGPRWSKIAESVGTRNGDQCWKRWYDCLDPRIDKSPWTSEEDSNLLVQVAQHGRNWTEIVNKHFPNRTSLSAKNRYSILQRKKQDGMSPSPSPSSATLCRSASPSASSSPALQWPSPQPVMASAAGPWDSGLNVPMMGLSEPHTDGTLQQQPSLVDGSYWYNTDLGLGGASISEPAELNRLTPEKTMGYQWVTSAPWTSPSYTTASVTAFQGLEAHQTNDNNIPRSTSSFVPSPVAFEATTPQYFDPTAYYPSAGNQTQPPVTSSSLYGTVHAQMSQTREDYLLPQSSW